MLEKCLIIWFNYAKSKYFNEYRYFDKISICVLKLTNSNEKLQNEVITFTMTGLIIKQIDPLF